MRGLRWSGIVCGLVWAAAVQAVPVDGTFTAVKTCPAYKSFTRGHNPGDIYSLPGRVYDLLEENKPGGAWVLLRVPELRDSRRWVAKACGTTRINGRIEPTVEGDAAVSGDVTVLGDITVSGNAGGNSGAGEQCHLANTYDSQVLALSWQAGFCEHYRYSGVKPECDNLNAGRIAVTNLTIHGLWPNRRACGHRYGNCADTPLELSEITVATIAPWMPNWYYSDEFGRHEWRKHGTCQALADDDYFLQMQALAEQFDRSPLGEYLRDNTGRNVSVKSMQEGLTAAMGKAVVAKLQLRCTGAGNRYLHEIWISLPAVVDVSAPLPALVSGAADQQDFQGSCGRTIYIEAPGPD